MAAILGNSVGVFIGVTVVLFGAAAYMTGHACARTWRPATQAMLYALLLGAANRFISYGLFDGELLSFSGYIVGVAVLEGIALLAYRLTQVRKMVAQYPWLYETAGPFSWRQKA